MPTLTASTVDVLTLIKYVKLTTYKGKDDPTLSSIVLYTVSGQVGEEVGGDTLLVAASSDGAVAGQYAIPVIGTLSGPVVIPETDIAWLATMLTTDLREHKSDGAETTVRMTFDMTNGVMSVRALADGAESENDRRGFVSLDTSGDYPLDTLAGLLLPDPVEKEISWTRAVLPSAYLSILAAATKMSPMEVSLYPTSDEKSSTLVAFLPQWRAVFPVGVGRDVGETVKSEEWKIPQKSRDDDK
jgi:hypothetical protein